MNKIQPGDILFFKAEYDGLVGDVTELAQRAFDGPIGHCETITDVLEDGSVWCLGANFDGVKFRHHAIDTYRHAIGRIGMKFNFTPELAQKTATDVFIELDNDKKLKYSRVALVGAVINAFLDRVTFRLWHKTGILSHGNHMFCSKLIAYIFYTACKSRFSRNGEMDININYVTPSDIYKAYEVNIIKDLGEKL